MSASLVAQEGPVGWRLAASFAAVLANGYFVAIEFALVKARASRIARMAAEGRRGAPAVSRILKRLDYYLSSCQLGITVASLVLGWLAEPAVAALLLRGAEAAGIPAADGPFLHTLALALSLSVITVLHMTIGEQVPKIMAIQRAESAAMLLAVPLLAFTYVLRPLIWVINAISSAILRLAGFSASIGHEGPMEVEELRAIFRASSRAGHITERQEAIGERVLGLVKREVRHVMVPRVEIASLSAEHGLEENLETIRAHGHSRFPLGDPGLDNVRGLVHARDVLAVLIRGGTPDLAALARAMPTVPDTMPLSRLIVHLQKLQVHCATVMDEHGTVVGLAFLEDALEEIVGPLPDEFDRADSRVLREPSGALEMIGSVSLPEASEALELDLGDEHDTIGGYLVARLGRVPNAGDSLEIPPYTVKILKVARGRVARLRFEAPGTTAAGPPG